VRIALAVIALALAFGVPGGPARAGPTRTDAEACATEKIRAASVSDRGGACSRLLAAYDNRLPDGLVGAGPEALRDWAMTLPTPAAANRHPALDPTAAAAVLARIAQERDAEPVSVWERIRRWLQSLFESDEKSKPPSWLSKLFEALGHIPPAAVRTTFWILAVLLVGFLLTLIVVELRASGVFTKRAKRIQATAARAGRTMETAQTPAPALSLDDIGRLSPDARASALLGWLLRVLMERRLLPPDRTLTNRELARQLPAPAAAGFRRFLRCVEPALYGGLVLRDDAFAEARTLASELARPSGAGAAQRTPTAGTGLP
jgi:hypothetical protein